jgi:hypothetical protein
MKIERCNKCFTLRGFTSEELCAGENNYFIKPDRYCNIARANGEGGITPCNGIFAPFVISAKMTLTTE